MRVKHVEMEDKVMKSMRFVSVEEKTEESTMCSFVFFFSLVKVEQMLYYTQQHDSLKKCLKKKAL